MSKIKNIKNKIICNIIPINENMFYSLPKEIKYEILKYACKFNKYQLIKTKEKLKQIKGRINNGYGLNIDDSVMERECNNIMMFCKMEYDNVPYFEIKYALIKEYYEHII